MISEKNYCTLMYFKKSDYDLLENEFLGNRTVYNSCRNKWLKSGKPKIFFKNNWSKENFLRELSVSNPFLKNCIHENLTSAIQDFDRDLFHKKFIEEKNIGSQQGFTLTYGAEIREKEIILPKFGIIELKFKVPNGHRRQLKIGTISNWLVATILVELTSDDFNFQLQYRLPWE